MLNPHVQASSSHNVGERTASRGVQTSSV